MSEAASRAADPASATHALLRESRGFWVVNAVNLGDNISYFLILSLLVPYLSEQGLSDQGAGYAISLYTGMVTLAMLWGGKVSDRLGVRRSIGISMLLSTVGRAMLAACPWIGVPATLAGLLIAAVGAAICQPALYSGVKEMCHPRATALGYSVLYATLSLGIGLGSFFSPFVRTSSDFGWGIRGLGLGLNGVMWAAVAVSAATLVAHWILFRPSMDPAVRNGAGEESLPIPGGVPWDPRFFYFICVLIPVRTLFAHQFMTASTYVLRVFPTSISDRFEWFMGLNPPIVLVLVPLFALTIRQVKLVDVMIAGTAVTTLSTFMLAGPPSRESLIGYIVLFSIGEAMWGSRFLEHVAELAPAGQLGLYMGVAGLPWFFAKFTTGLYSGSMLDHFVPAQGPRDPGTLWLIYGCFAALSPVGLALARRWLLKDLPKS